MSPLEKYTPKKFEDNKTSPNLSEKQSKSVEGQLLNLRANLGKRHERLRKREILRAKAESEQKADKLDRDQQKLVERKIYYKEMIESDTGHVSGFAFEEMYDFDFNKSEFSKWYQEYKDSGVNQLSIEAFILDKQYQELDTMRETLMETRIEGIFLKIYPNLSGDDKEEERKQKQDEIILSSKVFFSNNSSLLNEYFESDEDSKVELQKKILKQYKLEVFSDIDDKDKNIISIIEKLFDDLLFDYQEMMENRNSVKLLNPKMVQLLMDFRLTREIWDKELSKEAEKQAKNLKEVREVKKKTETLSDIPAHNIDFHKIYYGQSMSAGDKIGNNTPIIFERTGRKGRYKAIFPVMGNTGVSESYFQIRRIREEGISRLVFVFNDPLMDRPAIVSNNNAFRAQLNGLYLEKIMSDAIRSGSDYLGPQLNDIIKDQEMFVLAERLLYPKKLDEKALTIPESLIFEKLLFVLINSENHNSESTRYGNLLPIKNRLSLLKFVFMQDAMAVKIRTYLENQSLESLKKISIEKLLIANGIPANSGNFMKI